MRTLVIGDIHGNYKGLKQVLGASLFDYDKDRLICLGDVADGWPEVPECIEELLKIKNLIYIEGNHDTWHDDWLRNGASPIIWTEQGGKATLEAYIKRRPELIVKHRYFYQKNAKLWHVHKNKLFVHGGYKPDEPIENQRRRYLTWDRALWDGRFKWEQRGKCGIYDEVYMGHTSIFRYSEEPINVANLWFMDTGGGWEGRISLMDVDTKELWQSKLSSKHYPNHRGR